MNDLTCFSSILCDDNVVHLPIVRGYLAGPTNIPVNIMLDTGSTVNFISKKKVGRIAANLNVDESSLFTEVADDITVTLNSINNTRSLDTQLLKFRLTQPANTWLEAIAIDDIHAFPKLELDDKIVQAYELNGRFP